MLEKEMLTPVGRMVQGNPFKEVTKKKNGDPLTSKTTGLPRSEWFFALAIPKTDPGLPALIQAMQEVAASSQTGASAKAGYAWKYKDGDSPELKDKEGFAGCYVFRKYPLKV